MPPFASERKGALPCDDRCPGGKCWTHGNHSLTGSNPFERMWQRMTCSLPLFDIVEVHPLLGISVPDLDSRDWISSIRRDLCCEAGMSTRFFRTFVSLSRSTAVWLSSLERGAPHGVVPMGAAASDSVSSSVLKTMRRDQVAMGSVVIVPQRSGWSAGSVVGGPRSCV
jgi:hypothetical protein